MIRAVPLLTIFGASLSSSSTLASLILAYLKRFSYWAANDDALEVDYGLIANEFKNEKIFGDLGRNRERFCHACPGSCRQRHVVGVDALPVLSRGCHLTLSLSLSRVLFRHASQSCVTMDNQMQTNSRVI